MEDPLDRIEVASPCPMEWDDMRGDARVRRCDSCRLRVYNLSAMTRAEAMALIRHREGRLCIRFYRRSDGTVLTRDCPHGFRKAARSVLAWTVAGLSAAILLALSARVLWRGGEGGRLDVSPTWSEKFLDKLAQYESLRPVAEFLGWQPRATLGIWVPLNPVPPPDQPAESSD
jgi:hypothetical protein